MDLEVDLRQPTSEAMLVLEPSRQWLPSLAVERGGPRARPYTRLASDWAECECPADCPRDHGNE